VSSGHDNIAGDEGASAEARAIKEKTSLEGELSGGGDAATDDAVSLRNSPDGVLVGITRLHVLPVSSLQEKSIISTNVVQQKNFKNQFPFFYVLYT
jgi:hypothetical protein